MIDINLAQLPSGTYIVAVSGGVDSVVLLDALAAAAMKQPGYRLVVAHFDHGIRPDSADDAEFVGKLAEHYGLTFVCQSGHLGPDASEAMARQARYQFLLDTQTTQQAQAIITAHHHDDAVETALINLVRGTGRRGLSSLRSRPGVWRPLLTFSKADLMRYATQHHLTWREDPTNQDPKYLRNAIRHQLLPRAGQNWHHEFTQRLKRAADLNESIEQEIDQIVRHRLARQPATINRHWFIMLPHEVAAECLAAYLRHHGVTEIDQRMIERLTIAIKSAKVGTKHDIDHARYLLITKRSARIMDRHTLKSHVRSTKVR